MPAAAANGKGVKRKREKKEKKVRDPDAPKRPPSAYLLYQNEVRKAMQAKYPDLAYKEVLGKIAESWGAMTEQDKLVRRRFCQSWTHDAHCRRRAT